jgi:RNA polymerase sigma-70 factor (ECF subfamily)
VRWPDEPIDLSDRATFERVVRAHGERLRQFCFRRLGSWEAAEDAVAATFLQAWRHRKRVQLTQRTAPRWLLTVALNESRGSYRRERRSAAAELRQPTSVEPPDHAITVAERLDDERRMQAILAEVRKLRPEEQDVLALVVFAEQSYEEAAEILALPLGTARSRLARARQRLAAAEQGGDEGTGGGG